MTKAITCLHKDLFCVCERNRFGEHVNTWIINGDILMVFGWCCHREGKSGKEEHGSDVYLVLQIPFSARDGDERLNRMIGREDQTRAGTRQVPQEDRS